LSSRLQAASDDLVITSAAYRRALEAYVEIAAEAAMLESSEDTEYRGPEDIDERTRGLDNP